MKKVALAAIVILLLGVLQFLIMPWWGIVVLGLIVGYLQPDARKSGLGAFVGGLLLWGAAALYYDTRNQGILSARIGMLFQGLAGWHMVLVTALLGGILAGLGAITGSYFRLVLEKETK